MWSVVFVRLDGCLSFQNNYCWTLCENFSTRFCLTCRCYSPMTSETLYQFESLWPWLRVTYLQSKTCLVCFLILFSADQSEIWCSVVSIEFHSLIIVWISQLSEKVKVFAHFVTIVWCGMEEILGAVAICCLHQFHSTCLLFNRENSADMIWL